MNYAPCRRSAPVAHAPPVIVLFAFKTVGKREGREMRRENEREKKRQRERRRKIHTKTGISSGHPPTLDHSIFET